MGDIQGNPYQPNVGDLAGAQVSCRTALSLADKLAPSEANDSERAKANYKLADVLTTDDPKEALEKYDKARQIYAGLREKHPSNVEYLRGLVGMWDRIGSTHHLVMGDEAGALMSYRRCLEFAQQWLAVDPKARERVAFFREMIAKFSARTGDTVGAEDTIRESIHIYESSPTARSNAGELRRIAKAYKNLAEVQKLTGKLPEALESARTSLGITDSLLSKDPRNQQNQIDFHQALAFLVEILDKSGKPQEEREETVRALRFLKPLAGQKDASVYQIQGYAELLVATPFADLQDNAAALSYARKAVAMTHETDPTALDVLARAYARNSDFERALEIEQRAIALLPPTNPSQGVPELRKTLESNAASFRSGMQSRAEASQARR
jgi:tetratricopeptide (TPR) repeat protein